MKFKKLGKATLRAFGSASCCAGSAMFIDVATKVPTPQLKAIFFTMGAGMAVGAAMLGADAASETIKSFQDGDED